MENDIGRIKNELEQAQQNLHQTVTEVNRKVEAVSTQLQPEHLVERHPLIAACLAGALGFATGSRRDEPVALLLLGGLLGAILIEVSNNGSRKRDPGGVP